MECKEFALFVKYKLDDPTTLPTNTSLVFIRQIYIKNVYSAFFSIAK